MLTDTKTLSGKQIEEYFKTQSGQAEPLSPLAFLSSEMGEDIVRKKTKVKEQLTPEITEPEVKEVKEPEKLPEQEPLILTNEVGQTPTFYNPDINISNIQRYLDQGYEVLSGSLPSGVSIGGQADPVQEQINQQEQDVATARTDIETAQDRLRNLDITKDPAFQNISAGITSSWNERIAEMEKANLSRVAGMKQLGVRLGAKYTGDIYGGIITAEETAGIQRVSNLEAKKNEALARAETAFRSERWDEYVYFVEEAEKRYEEEVEEMNLLNDQAIEQNKLLQTEISKTMINDAVLNTLATTGLTDTASIYATLRNQGIETTADEVKKIIASFVPTQTPADKQIANAYEFGKNDVGKLIASGFSGTDIQATQDVLNQYGLYGKVPELDGQPLSEFINPQQLAVIKDILYPPVKQTGKPEIKKEDIDYKTSILIPRIGKQIYGTRISDLETERVEGFVTQGMALGKNQYEIIDDVLGYQVERNQPLANGLRNTLLATVGENGLFGFDMLGLARLINMGEDLMAVRKVENSKMLEAQTMVGRESFVAEADVEYISNKVKDIEDLLGVGWSDEVGAFGGNFTTWLSKKFGYGQATKIKAKVTAITADMVNKRAGSAITDTEWEKIIAPNVPAMNDSPEAFRDKLNELVIDTLERYNSERKMVALPQFSRNNITNPETRIKLYGGSEDPNPLDIQTDIANPLELNI